MSDTRRTSLGHWLDVPDENITVVARMTVNRRDLARNGTVPPEEWDFDGLVGVDQLGLIYDCEITVESVVA